MAKIEKGLNEMRIKKYNEEVQNEDSEWIDEFWTEIAEDKNYTKEDIVNCILDDFNGGQISRTAMYYYMSTLAGWEGKYS